MLIIKTIGDTTTVQTGGRQSLGEQLFELTHSVQAAVGTIATDFGMPIEKIMGALILLLQDEEVGFVEPVPSEDKGSKDTVIN